jgi:hypothetical protein
MIVMLAACSSRGDPAPEAKAGPTAPSAAFALTPLEQKLMRIDLALARFDPSFHALRIEWPGEAVDQWRWPTWVTQKDQVEILDGLLSAAGTAPSVPALDLAVSDYARQMTTDVQALEQLVARWETVIEDHPSANRPTTAEVVPILTRFAAASQRVYAALRAARPLDRFVPGSKLAIYRRCTEALATLADLPPQTQEPAPSDSEPANTASIKAAVDEVSRRARACIRASLDYLDQRALTGATSRNNGLYVADLATKIGMYLLIDSEHLAQSRENYSSSRNISQVAAYFAEQFPAFVGTKPP